MENTNPTPTLPMVEVEGFSFPKRIPNQEWITKHLPQMEDEEAVAFYNLLKERRWTDHEFEVRIYPLRPELRPEED